MSDSESSSESFYSCQEAVSEQEPDLESVPEPVSTDSVAFVTQEPYVSPPSDQPISYITFLSSPLSHNYHDLVSPTLFHTPVHTGSHHGFQSQPFLFTANNTEDLPTVHSSDIPDISIASSLCSSPITNNIIHKMPKHPVYFVYRSYSTPRLTGCHAFVYTLFPI